VFGGTRQCASPSATVNSLLLAFEIQFGRLLLAITFTCDLISQRLTFKRQDKFHLPFLLLNFESDCVSHHCAVRDFVAVTLILTASSGHHIASLFQDHQRWTRVAILWCQRAFPIPGDVGSSDGERARKQDKYRNKVFSPGIMPPCAVYEGQLLFVQVYSLSVAPVGESRSPGEPVWRRGKCLLTD